MLVDFIILMMEYVLVETIGRWNPHSYGYRRMYGFAFYIKCAKIFGPTMLLLAGSSFAIPSAAL